jgi:hypothetical protein
MGLFDNPQYFNVASQIEDFQKRDQIRLKCVSSTNIVQTGESKQNNAFLSPAINANIIDNNDININPLSSQANCSITKSQSNNLSIAVTTSGTLSERKLKLKHKIKSIEIKIFLSILAGFMLAQNLNWLFYFMKPFDENSNVLKWIDLVVIGCLCVSLSFIAVLLYGAWNFETQGIMGVFLFNGVQLGMLFFAALYFYHHNEEGEAIEPEHNDRVHRIISITVFLIADLFAMFLLLWLLVKKIQTEKKKLRKMKQNPKIKKPDLV